MIFEGGSSWGEYGERGEPAYNVVWGLCPRGSRGSSPGQRIRGSNPPKTESFLVFAQPKERQIYPILADSWQMAS